MTKNYASILTELGITWRPTGYGEARIKCPLPDHQDKHPSCNVNLTTGLWYCHSCGVGGNMNQLARGIGKQIEIKSVPVRTRPQGQRKPLPNIEWVQRGCNDLINDTEWLSLLGQERLITLSTVKKFSLRGYKECVIIPVYDVRGSLVNVKVWNAHRLPSRNKMMPWTIGHGTHPFPGVALKESTLLYLEGEGDVLAAWSAGIPAITLGGAGNRITKYPSVWKDKHLFLCYDRDKAGYEAENRNFAELTDAGALVTKIDLRELGGNEGEDFTDVLKRCGNEFATGIKEKMEVF